MSNYGNNGVGGQGNGKGKDVNSLTFDGSNYPVPSRVAASTASAARQTALASAPTFQRTDEPVIITMANYPRPSQSAAPSASTVRPAPAFANSRPVVATPSGPGGSSIAAQATSRSTLNPMAPSWVAASATITSFQTVSRSTLNPTTPYSLTAPAATTTAPTATPPTGRALPMDPANPPVASVTDNRCSIRIYRLPADLDKHTLTAEIVRVASSNGLYLNGRVGFAKGRQGSTTAIVKFFRPDHARNAISIMPSQLFDGTYGAQLELMLSF